jgi:hypothetical protein
VEAVSSTIHLRKLQPSLSKIIRVMYANVVFSRSTYFHIDFWLVLVMATSFAVGNCSTFFFFIYYFVLKKLSGTPFPDHKNQQGLKTSVREAKDLGIGV